MCEAKKPTQKQPCSLSLFRNKEIVLLESTKLSNSIIMAYFSSADMTVCVVLLLFVCKFL